MKFLLTSSGISNDSIRNALVDLLGKPIAESSALCIPTAAYACPGGAAMAWRFIRGVAKSPLCELGWKSLGVLELTALPSLKAEQWVPVVQEADALLVYGGDVLCLRGGERWEHGGHPQLRRGLRRLVLSRASGKSSAHRRRESARTGGFFGVSAPGSPRESRQFPGQRRKMGRQGAGADVCD